MRGFHLIYMKSFEQRLAERLAAPTTYKEYIYLNPEIMKAIKEGRETIPNPFHAGSNS